AMGGASFGGNVGGALAAVQAQKAGTGMELVVYEKVAIGRGGAWSNNPWLLEMPDPITKATWDNYACVSPKKAKELDAELTSITEVENAKRVIKINANGTEMLLPVVVVPGMHNDVVAVALGYGRDPKVGRAAANTGKNAYPFVSFNGQTFSYATNATVEKTSEKYDIAITQTHHSYEGRPIIHEYTLDEFTKDPKHLFNERKNELEHYAHLAWETGHGEHGAEGHGATDIGEANKQLEEGFRENGTLYPNFTKPGIHWGMSIDLTSCIGCGACVIGCQAENNISVVGKT